MAPQVQAFMTRLHMIQPGAAVLVAVSGGPDSLCLLHLLVSLRTELGVTLHVGHMDHQLRGPDSAADAAFVEATAKQWHIPATIEVGDVHAYADTHRLNLHDAARRLRYAFLGRLAAEIGASTIAVAHTANDQAETVLMHLLRGAGTAGLRGMRPVTLLSEITNRLVPDSENDVCVIRPLLETPRAQIEQYCSEHHLTPRLDNTNHDPSYTRNRIRHELLPQLATHNTHIVEALRRTAAICSDEYAFIQQALDSHWLALVRVRPDGIDFDGTLWRELPSTLQRAALRRAFALLGGDNTLAWEQIEQAREVVGRGVGKQVALSDGLSITAAYGGSFTMGTPLVEGPQVCEALTTLPVPGQVALSDGWTLTIAEGPAGACRDQWEVCFDATRICGQLMVRGRQPGDVIRPAGGQGTRKLQDLFVDAKVPRALRDRWPIILDQAQILWVAGIRAAEGVTAGQETQHLLWIRVRTGDVEQVSVT